jgi:aryl-alcohol dehydrogenase-like predicted oxidoreductase
MNYHYLGRSHLKVSPLCLGAMVFGGETDEATAKRIIDKAGAAGINFIDTADAYHAGRSEEGVGRSIAAQRDTLAWCRTARWRVACSAANMRWTRRRRPTPAPGVATNVSSTG